MSVSIEVVFVASFISFLAGMLVASLIGGCAERSVIAMIRKIIENMDECDMPKVIAAVDKVRVECSKD